MPPEVLEQRPEPVEPRPEPVEPRPEPVEPRPELVEPRPELVEGLGCVTHQPGWVAEPGRVFDRLTSELIWEQLPITLFGRTVPTPRLTAWVGDRAYAYSGVVNHPQPWPPTLLALRDRLIAELGVPFNSCLANLYRDGSDSMGYHSDDEPELGPRPVIASVSLGARRSFTLRHRISRQRWTWALGGGDLLVMRDEAQSDYAHAVPKTTRPVMARMNLTFRQFYA